MTGPPSTDGSSHVSQADIARSARDASLSGRVVAAHTSLSSFGTVEGGADALIDAFLGEGCTLVVPTFSPYFEISPSIDERLERNGMAYAPPTAIGADSPRYGSTSLNVARDMGAIPQAALNRDRTVRGGHPLNSFAAIGPEAVRLVAESDADDVYQPLKRVIDFDGAVLLMGVGYWSLTLIHLAERNAGRALFRRWALDPSGRVRPYEVGSCSAGFHSLRGHLDPLADRRTVGSSKWRCLNAREALHAATEAILEAPSLAACDDPDCLRCADHLAGGPVLHRGGDQN